MPDAPWDDVVGDGFEKMTPDGKDDGNFLIASQKSWFAVLFAVFWVTTKNANGFSFGGLYYIYPYFSYDSLSNPSWNPKVIN